MVWLIFTLEIILQYFLKIRVKNYLWVEKLIIYYANEKTSFFIYNMSDEQLIFYGFDDLSSKIERDAPLDKSIFKSSNGVFSYNEPFCKECNSHKVVKWGYNTRKLYTVDGDEIKVKVQRYYCKTCGKLTQTEFLDDYDAYSYFNKHTIVKSNKSKELDNISLRNLVKYHIIFNNVHMSH